jgi:hypothetical protein
VGFVCFGSMGFELKVSCLLHRYSLSLEPLCQPCKWVVVFFFFNPHLKVKNTPVIKFTEVQKMKSQML